MPLAFHLASALLVAASALTAPLPSFAQEDLMPQISAVYAEVWDDKPFPAARNLCVKGWATMAALGDADARQRLELLAATYSEQYRLTAVQGLVAAGDQAIVHDLMNIAADPSASRRERIAALAIGAANSPTSIPIAAERLACELSTDPRAERGMFQVLMEHATEPSRDTMEAALLQTIPSASNPTGDTCRASWALTALRHIGSPKSAPVLHRVTELPVNSPWSRLRIRALRTLNDIGDSEYAVRTLTDSYNSERDPEIRIICAGALVEAGEESFRPTVWQGMYDEQEHVREQAYLILREQGDAAYVRKAAQDFSVELDRTHAPGYVGFWPLTHPLEENFFPNHLRDYLVEIARTGRTDMAKTTALGMLLQWCPRLDAADVLLISRPVLDAPLPVLPSSLPESNWPNELRELHNRWEHTMISLAAVVRFGSSEVRDEALSKLETAIENARSSQRDYIVCDYLGLSQSKDAIRLLSPSLHEGLPPLTRIKAATSILAILASNTLR